MNFGELFSKSEAKGNYEISSLASSSVPCCFAASRCASSSCSRRAPLARSRTPSCIVASFTMRQRSPACRLRSKSLRRLRARFRPTPDLFFDRIGDRLAGGLLCGLLLSGHSPELGSMCMEILAAKNHKTETLQSSSDRSVADDGLGLSCEISS